MKTIKEILNKQFECIFNLVDGNPDYHYAVAEILDRLEKELYQHRQDELGVVLAEEEAENER